MLFSLIYGCFTLIFFSFSHSVREIAFVIQRRGCRTTVRKKLQDGIGEYLKKKSISFYDAGAEGFYHGLVLGLVALMDNQYRIRSNRESGDGRYDISLFPRKNKYPGMIIISNQEQMRITTEW